MQVDIKQLLTLYIYKFKLNKMQHIHKYLLPAMRIRRTLHCKL